MADTIILTLPEAKAFLGKDATIDDAVLQSLINSVARVLERQVGPIDPATYTRVLCSEGDEGLVFPHRNILTVASAVYIETGAAISADLSAGNLVIDTQAGIVYLKTGYWPNEELLVTYTAGSAAVPANVKDAAKLAVKNVWQHKRGSARGDQGPVTPAVILTPAVLALLAPDTVALGFA